jgi:hypothetical protein
MFYGPPGQYMWKSLESLSLSLSLYIYIYICLGCQVQMDLILFLFHSPCIRESIRKSIEVGIVLEVSPYATCGQTYWQVCVCFPEGMSKNYGSRLMLGNFRTVAEMLHISYLEDFQKNKGCVTLGPCHLH